MAKVMLILEESKSCVDCPCFQGYDILNAYCGKSKNNIEFDEVDGLIRPDWCPLKPVPEREYDADPWDDYYRGVEDGWNNCIDEILGE